MKLGFGFRLPWQRKDTEPVEQTPLPSPETGQRAELVRWQRDVDRRLAYLENALDGIAPRKVHPAEADS